MCKVFFVNKSSFFLANKKMHAKKTEVIIFFKKVITMVRKTLIAGNWKMNGHQEDGVALAKGVALEVKKSGRRDCEVLICPPYTLLMSAKKAIKGSRVQLGAQDCHFDAKGAHTGDISPLMLKDLGCQYVILGHSERRTDHKESNELIAKKASAAIEAGLKVIICIGETEKERDENKTIEVCTSQIIRSCKCKQNAHFIWW